jgi:hypothetical protein
MQSLALNVEVLNAEGAIVTLKDDDFERELASEQLDGINLSRNESLSNDSDEPLYF